MNTEIGKKITFKIISTVFISLYLLNSENATETIMSKFQFISHVIQPLGDEWLRERRKTVHGNSQGGEKNQKHTSGVKTLPKNRKCLYGMLSATEKNMITECICKLFVCICK
jgi:hypothetical protein